MSEYVVEMIDESSPTEVLINEYAKGDKGEDGKSAYELAVEQGFTGTLADWLLSLEGQPGEGVPPGGVSGQILTKSSSSDFDTAWTNGGSSDYNDLINKPTIAGVTVEGYKSFEDFDVASLPLLENEASARAAADELLNNKIDSIKTVRFLKTEELPSQGEENIIYLLPIENGGGDNFYYEYIFVNGAWETIGTTQVNLSDYYTKTETDNFISVIGELVSLEEENRTEAVNNLYAAIGDERIEREQGISSLNASLESEITKTDGLASDLAAEISRSTQADSDLRASFDALDTALQEEAEERGRADSAFEQALEDCNNNLLNEIQAREQADEEFGEAVAAAASALSDMINMVSETVADNYTAQRAIGTGLTNEINRSTAKDSETETRLSAVEQASSAHATTLYVDSKDSALQSNLTLTADDLQGQVDEVNSSISTLQAQVNSMGGGAVYLPRYDLATENITQGLLDSFALANGYEKPFKSNITIIDANNHEWAYNADIEQWVDTGIFTSSTATNTSLGIVKGTLAPYGVSINASGEMTVNTGNFGGFSQVDFTAAKDSKLAGIAEGANKTERTSQLTNDSGFAYSNDPRFSDSRASNDVPAWAKAASKPSYTASEVGAEASGAVASHNSSSDAHVSLLVQYLKSTGNSTSTNVTVPSAAASRSDLSSGSLGSLFSQLRKWYADLKTVAWTGSYNDLTDKPVQILIVTQSAMNSIISGGTQAANTVYIVQG